MVGKGMVRKGMAGVTMVWVTMLGLSLLGSLGLLSSDALAQRAPAKADVQRGATLAAVCIGCHGAASQATATAATAATAATTVSTATAVTAAPGMPRLEAQPEAFLVLQLTLIREGLREVPGMTALMRGLKDQDLTDLAGYFARLPAPIAAAQTPQPARYAQGQQLASRLLCGSCHRADYSGQAQLPRLAAQDEAYLRQSLRAYRDNQRSGADTSMNGVMHGISDSDIDALAHYLHHFQPPPSARTSATPAFMRRSAMSSTARSAVSDALWAVTTFR
jgi:cytochrome c553